MRGGPPIRAPVRAPGRDTWHARGVRRIGIVILLGLLCTACAAGPSSRPGLAIAGHSAGSPAEETTDAPSTPAPPDVPTRTPGWHQCPNGPVPGPDAPAGLTFTCATISGPLDPKTSDAGVRIDLTRAATDETPDGAAPIVLVAGTAQSSRDALGTLAGSPGGALLGSHPVVAVDRRGMGPSTDPDCFARGDGADLTTAGRGVDPQARAQSMMDTVDAVTVSCTDVLRPAVDAFDAVHAASDIDTLRTYWGVDRIALLTVGSGSDVALAYAAHQPDHLARLILDSPQPVRQDAATIAQHRAQADQAALARFESDCIEAGCAIADDPGGTLDTLLDSARTGLIRQVSPGSVLTVIRRTLSDDSRNWDQRVDRLGDLLHGAATGDVETLEVFANARSLTSGAFVAQCSDAPPSVTVEDAIQAQTDWAQRYPVFGTDAAVRMLTCGSWPSHPDFALPDNLDVPVLLYSGAADPVVGAGSVDSVTAALTRAGISFSAVNWGGVGHGALWNSTCSAQQFGRYMSDAVLPPDGTACPA